MPIDASTLVLFRKRLTADILREANEYLLEKHEEEQDDGLSVLGGGTGEDGNSGTLILDAACSLVNIRYLQDFDLLNEAGEKPEAIIIRYCKPRPALSGDVPPPGREELSGTGKYEEAQQLGTIEKICFDASYNECGCLEDAAEKKGNI